MARIARMKGRRATRKFIPVTQEHCDKGCRADAAHCALAQAVMEKYPQAEHVSCTLREVAWSDPKTNERHRYFTPPKGAKAIRNYDAGVPVKPFILILNEGITVPRGWKSKHPGSTRKGKRYIPKGGKAAIRYTRFRTFGANNIKDDETSL